MYIKYEYTIFAMKYSFDSEYIVCCNAKIIMNNINNSNNSIIIANYSDDCIF